MDPQCTTSIAFRWRPTGLRGEASDFVRVVDEGGVTLALLANGFDYMFSACWPPGSRLLLDLFMSAWRNTSGTAHDRLLAAFNMAQQQFTEQSGALLAPDPPIFPDDVPLAVLFATVIEGTTAHFAWIGGDVAFVVRDARLIGETCPHTLVEQVRRELPEWLELGSVPNVLLRTIGSKSSDMDPPGYLAVDVVAGDTVVLLSRAALHGPCVAVGDVVAATAQVRSPSELATYLAGAGFLGHNTPYTAVAVLQLESALDTSPSAARRMGLHDLRSTRRVGLLCETLIRFWTALSGRRARPRPSSPEIP